MKTTNVTIWAVAIALGLFAITACEKEKKEEEPPATQTTPTPKPGDADGVLANIKIYSSQSTPVGNIDVEIGAAAAYFVGTDGKFLDAGTVKVYDHVLQKLSNPANYYFLSSTESMPMGIEYLTKIDWSVTGSSSVPAFTKNISDGGIPYVGKITTTGPLSLNGCMLSVEAVDGADSVMFIIGDAIRTLPGYTTNCQFTKEMLSNVKPGLQPVFVIPYRMTSEVIQGKKIYFVREAARTMMIEFTN